MGPQHSRIAKAVELALAGATVLTANTRAARRLRLEVERHALRDRPVCETADILPLSAWVQRTWTDALLAGTVDRALLLPNVQARLWQEIVAHSSEGRQLLSHHAAADLAAEAYGLVNEYRLPRQRSLFTETAESRAFYGWAEAFDQRCQRENWISAASACTALIGHIPRLSLPQTLVFFGFDSLTPLQAALVNALREAGRDVHTLLPEPVPRAIAARSISCLDTTSELHAAASWARAKLQAAPSTQIGIIVPGLEGLRSQIISVFDQTLHPEQRLLSASRAPKLYEISLGRPLREHPLVRTTLRVLRLLVSSLTSDEWGALLRSPYLAGGRREGNARARLEFELRKKLRATVTLRYLLTLNKLTLAPELARMLTRLQSQFAKIPAKLTHTQWTEHVRSLLRMSVSLGDSESEFAFSSEEFQAATKWDELLNNFCALDQVLPARKIADIQRDLERAASEATFAVENEAAPIQIVGPRAASGESFDALWFCGLSDETWPQRGQPNPFIPFSIQRSAGLPFCTAADNLREAEQITGRLLESADECILSWPQREEDRLMRPSTLLAGTTRISLTDLETCDAPSWNALQGKTKLEEFTDEVAPAITNDDLHHHGTSLLLWQSGCPFRAFAQARLDADELRDTSLGLTPIERGNVTEAALQHMWEQLRGSANLATLTEAQVEEAISKSIEHALQTCFPQGTDSWLLQHRAIERDRLHNLMHAWLVVENQREQFEVMDHQQIVELDLSGLKISGKIDRLDRMSTGEYVVLDYKTGGSTYTKKLWEMPRPQDPQLPIYVVAQQRRGHEIAGVAFARVRARKCEFVGLAPRQSVLVKRPERPDEFHQTIDSWAPELERLAANLLAGQAEVDPKYAPGTTRSTCNHCHLGPLCRVAELVAPADEDELEEIRDDQ